MNCEKSSETFKSGGGVIGGVGGFKNFWNDHIMERFIKANLFIICCVAAGLLLVSKYWFENVKNKIRIRNKRRKLGAKC